MLFTLLAATAALVPLGRSEISAAVPDTVLQVALEAPSFRADSSLRDMLEKTAGTNGVVIAGAIDPPGSTLSVVVKKNQPQRTSAQWRAEELGAGGDAFQIGEVACRELGKETAPEVHDTQFDAIVLAGGLVFDVHVTTRTDANGAGMSRSDFKKVAESFRCVFVRHGEPKNLPRDARDAMHRAMANWPSWQRTLQGEMARKPEDASLCFVYGELLLLSDAKPGEVVTAHEKALECFQKLRTPTTEQRFAWMACEQAIGLAQLDLAKLTEAIPHLDKSYEIAGQLRNSSRPYTAYALAQAHAHTGDAGEAVRFLGEAIQGDGDLKKTAREDKTFAPIQGDKRFQALIGR